MMSREAPSKRTIFVARHNFHVASKIKLYYDSKTSRCGNRYILNLTTCEALQHAVPFFAAFVQYVIQYLFHESICSVTV